jgi:hypothetical protein
MTIRCGPLPYHKVDPGLQQEGVADMEKIERRVRLPGNLLREKLGKHGEAQNRRRRRCPYKTLLGIGHRSASANSTAMKSVATIVNRVSDRSCRCRHRSAPKPNTNPALEEALPEGFVLMRCT